MSITTFFTAGEVAAEIKSRLQAVRLTNDCETDIGRDVMMGRRKIPGDDQPPCIIVIEGLDDIGDQVGRTPSCLILQDYLIDGFDACDPDNPNDKAHAMIRDIKRAIFAGGSTFGEKVRAVRYRSRDIGPRADGAALVQVRVAITVEYVENLLNP
jgi:hypothetical protein